MRLYRFKTFRTTYYFPPIEKGQEFLYGLYTPYGLVAKVYWWLFRNLSIVRLINRVDSSCLEFSYGTIIKLMPEGCVLSFNMGSPGIEQKISILGVDSGGNRFFAKYSEKPEAIKLSRNEVRVLTKLKGLNQTPDLYYYSDCDDYCFIRTSFVKGCTMKSLNMNNDIVDLAIKISKCPFDTGNNNIHLKTGLAHGDFCPWNMLVDNGEIHLIDWELAGEKPLGFDLFTFICETSATFNRKERLSSAIKTNEVFLRKYFDAFEIDSFDSYLDVFAHYKYERELSKGDMYLYGKYKELAEDLALSQ